MREKAYEAAAREGHDVYERLAPQHGYETQEKSRVECEQLPEQHRKLMIAAYRAGVDAFLDALPGEVYVLTQRYVRPDCPHAGTYQGHDEGCYPARYIKLKGDTV